MKKSLNLLNKLVTTLFFVILIDQLSKLNLVWKFNLGLEFNFLQLILVTNLTLLTNILDYAVSNSLSILKAPYKIRTLLVDDSTRILKQVFNNTTNKYFIVPAVLFLIGLILSTFSLFKGTKNGVFTLRQKEKIRTINNDFLEASESAKAVFKADYNNLGIVAVRFNTGHRSNQDELLFRLKDENEDEDVYVNKYNTDQFQNQELFPFGFPIVKDSKDKEFEFVITSLKGASESAVAVSKHQPNFIAKYQFDKANLIDNKQDFIIFIKNKFVTSLEEISFLSTTIIYFLPLIIYLLSLIPQIKISNLLGTIEDYFSFSLIVYLLIEILNQGLILGQKHLDWYIASTGHLDLARNVLLVITMLLALLAAIFGQEIRKKD